MPLLALFRLAFAPAPAVSALTSPHRLTRRLILQKARGQAVLPSRVALALPPSVSERFQILFHSPHRGSFHLSLTVLVRYRSSRVFSLGEWSPLFPTGLACPVVLRPSGPPLSGFAYGTLTPSGWPSQCHSATLLGACCRRLQPRPPWWPVWASPLSLATTRGILSFPPGTEMFQFPGFPPSGLCVQPQGDGLSHRRVSPFGYHRFSACTRLPDAFRSVPRPSSALDAWASPVRLASLVSCCGDRDRSRLSRVCPSFSCF